ncbi:hypothetical protein ECH_0268 [Ehrlichia chaffeensis str. Arkansas]|uniref:Uncharacterized protein n=1 Tax=Ehrlichia chaffeensis (strain ATCC CRL-10679 / Arkansas) TaxID=205920 RepID=Q2GHJ4_EHRCR|nr:hypothetical protein ECH_0268 [Ehrlichia chaffeensis str. Arkansas]
MLTKIIEKLNTFYLSLLHNIKFIQTNINEYCIKKYKTLCLLSSILERT